MPPSKRSRSCSSLRSSQKRIATASCTRDTPSENELTNLRNSCVELLETVGQSLVELADIPTPSIMSPPSPLASLSRPNSPTKLSDANYRYRVIQRAKIFVDSELPVDVEQYVDTNIFHPWVDTEDVTIVAKDLLTASKALVLGAFVETDWLVPLRSAIDRLIPVGLLVASNRDWRDDMKPEVHSPVPLIPNKRDVSNEPISRFLPTQDIVEKPTSILELKDPRPDICVGFSDSELANALLVTKAKDGAETFLQDLQENSILISDPHCTPLGLRFPFFMVEARAAATGGNLYQAQNQVAVSGSTALKIFNALSDLHDPQEDRELFAKPRLAFSVTTEGPIHELWLHFQRAEEVKFYMVCLGSWRTTLEDGALELVRHISAVLRWGMEHLKDEIISLL